MNAVFEWSDRRAVVRNRRELDATLARLMDSGESESPVLVRIECEGHEATVGLGVETAFVQFAGAGGEPPYMVAVGDASAVGDVTFVLDGEHDTEVAASQVVPAKVAIDLVREFVQTGKRPATVEWAEI